MAKEKTIQKKSTLKASILVDALLKNKNDREIYCATDLTKKWSYIDFIDPKTKLPVLSLEWLFGSRGLLAGRILKLQANYGVGKSSFMWYIYACGQINHVAWCYHMETEAAPPPPDFIASFGCDPANLAIGQPKSLEQAFELIDETIATIRGGFGGGINPETGRTQKSQFTDPLDPLMESPILIGFDSISAVDTEAKVEQDILDLSKTSAVAMHSRKISEWFRNRVERLKSTQTLLMMTAQEKTNIKTGPAAFMAGGDNEEYATIANRTIGFHSTWVVKMSALPYIDKTSGENIGERITLFTHKNKLSPKNRQLVLYLVRDKGFDLVKTDADFLINHPVSPIAAKRHAHGISCALLSEKSFKNDLEFLQAFYSRQDLVMEVREKLRIRGFNFAFETNYMAPYEENLDITDAEVKIK